MRYRLRMLLILLAIGPPLLAAAWWYYSQPMLVYVFAFSLIGIIPQLLVAAFG